MFEDPTNILYLPWVKQKQVVLVVVPDMFDMKGWVEECGFMDRKADEEALRREALDPGTWSKVELTYPQLQGLRNMSYIYLGWKGQLRCRHRATTSDQGLSTKMVLDARKAWPEWGSHFKMGVPYQWGFSEVELVAQFPLPRFLAEGWWDIWQPVVGVMSAQAPIDEEPEWKPGRYKVAAGGILVPEH